jgi:type II secretory pathway component GspD/PulD (secretin)
MRFKVDNMDVLDVLDRLALQTRSFWTALDSKTILVAPDNPTKRREFDRQLARTFHLPNASATAIMEIVTSLRTLLNLRYVATTSTTNALLIRDTPNRLAIAEKLITDLSTPPPVAGSVTETPLGSESGFVLNRRAARSFATAQPQLQITVTGPFSFDMSESARRAYEEVAARAGLRVIFDSRFRDAVTAVLKLENVSVIDALDFLSLRTGNIWEVVDANTIIIGPDVPAVRSELERRAAKTIRVSNVGTEALPEILMALRTILNLRNVAVVPSAIVIEDTTANIAFAEKIVADLDRPARR